MGGWMVWGVWEFCMICLVYQWQVFWPDDVYHVRGYVCGEMVALV